MRHGTYRGPNAEELRNWEKMENLFRDSQCPNCGTVLPNMAFLLEWQRPGSFSQDQTRQRRPGPKPESGGAAKNE
jgi:hypothetical protein